MPSDNRSAQDRSDEINEFVPDTFPKLLLHHASKRGERVAVREKSRGIWHALSWRQLADEVAAVAGALHARGLQRGAHVAFIGDNRPRLHAAMCAAQWLGAIVVPLYQDATADEIAVPIQSAQVSLVFAEDQEQVDKLLEIAHRCPAIRSIVYDDDRGMRHYKHPQLISYDALLEQGHQVAAAKREQLQAEVERSSGQDTACLIFTAGATGPAKAAVFTHAALIDRARAAAAMDELNDADVAMAYLPPAWIGQHLVGFAQPMVVGYCTCFPESPETMLADMREVGPTYFLAPPRVLETLLTQMTIRMSSAGRVMRAMHRHFMSVAERAGGRILSGEPVSLADRLAYFVGNLLIFGPLRDVLGMSRLRTAYVAGEAAGVDLLMFFRSIGINLKQLYGSTETGFFVAMQRNGQIVPESVGPAAEGVELTFTAQREILVRSRGLFKEYYGAPEATKATRNEEGWVHTGDAGFLDSSGCLRIIDRISDVGALNDGTLFAPRPLENRVKYSHYIKEVIAFGNRRDTICMLIDIDIAAVGNWADKQSISYTGHADLASRSEVYGLIADCIARVNAKLALEPALATSQIHRFMILPRQLDADDGVLTRMRTVRRDVIAVRYRALVEAMYEGRATASFEPAFRGEDGRAVALTADVPIGDARTFAAAHVGKAA